MCGSGTTFIEAKVVADIERIKESKLGTAIRRWVPFGIGNTLSVGTVLFPDNAPLLTLGAIGIQAIGLTADAPRISGHFDGIRSMLLSANEYVLKATSLPNFLGQDFLRYTEA